MFYPQQIVYFHVFSSKKSGMAPHLWDPYRVLNITHRDDEWMHCVGHVDRHRGARCRCEISEENYEKVRDILDQMEAKPPGEVSKLLLRLARRSLCERYHSNQQTRVLKEWEEAVQVAEAGYLKTKLLKQRNTKLSFEVEELRAQLAEVGKLSHQLTSICQRFEQYKKDAEARSATQARREVVLRSQLAEASQVSAQRLADLEKMTANENFLIEKRRDLQSQLALQRVARERHVQRILKDAANNIELRQDLLARADSLQEQLSAEHHDVEELKKCLIDTKRNEENASNELASLRSQVADERHSYHDQFKAATAHEASLRDQLSTERQNSDQLRQDLKEAETKQITTSEEAESLRSQLGTEQHKSKQLSKALSVVEMKRTMLSEDVRNLLSQLVTERQNSDRLDRELNTMKTEHISLAGQLSTERQTSVQLRKSLDETKPERAALVTQMKSMQVKLETERRDLEKLSYELGATKAQETALTQQLEEQCSVAAAQDAAYSAQIARMLERIANLERYSLSRLFSAFQDKLNSMLKSAVSWLAGRRRRKQTVAGDGQQRDAA